MRVSTFCMVGVTFLAAASMIYAEDWSQFRGPTGNGVAEGSLPSSWDQETNLRWKVKIPGVGWSAPIIVGDKVFVTTAVADNQPRPSGNAGGGRPGGGPGGRGPGGFGPGRGAPGGGGPPRFTPPKPGEIIPSFLKQQLELTQAQEQGLNELQKVVDDELAKLLTEEQSDKLQNPMEQGRGRFRFPTPGVVLSATDQDDINLTDEQKAKLADLQKTVDQKLASLLSDAQKKQLTDMRPGRGGPGGPGGFGNRKPPEDIYRWEIHCLDRNTGKTLWKQVALEGSPRTTTDRSNTYATETPISDGKHVYAYFGMHGVYCYDLSGNLVWKKDLGSFPTAGGWGTASSPVLADSRLIILCDNEEDSFLVALDTRTGDELWRVTRDDRTTYATPYVWKNDLRTEIIALGSPKVRSYDPATGKQLWGMTIGNGRCSASPVGDAEMIYVGLDGGSGGPPGRRDENTNQSAGGLFAVKAGASGNLDNDEESVVWNSPQNGPELSSPVLYDGYIYVIRRDGGIITCLNAKTGKQEYRKRLPEAKAFWSSPWAGDGKIYCLDDGGTTYAIEAGPDFNLLEQNKLDEMFWASSAAADGAIFLRSVDHLYCVGK